MPVVRSVTTVTLRPAGMLGGQLRQLRLDLVDRGDDVGARLALDVENDAGLERGGRLFGRADVVVGPELVVLGPRDDGRDVLQPDRVAVLVGDDLVGVVVGVQQLVVAVDGVGSGRPVERALGLVGVGRGDGRAQAFQRHAIGGQRARVDLDPHRRPLAAGDGDQPDAGDLRDLLPQLRFRQALNVGQRHGLRRQRQGDDRRVGGVDLGVDRRRRQIDRQQVARRVDRRLHLLLGHVEREVEVELQRDHRRAAGRDRRHAVQVGHLAELPLQRRGDGLRHHLRAAARIGGLHLDGRVIDLGQGRQRQEVERHQSRQQDGRHQQRGRHRTLDKGA